MRSVLSSFQQVFRNVRYGIIAGLVALLVFVLATWLPNLGLVWQITKSSTIAFSDKFGFLLSLVGSIQTNFTVVSASYTIIIAFLFGINIAMLTYYIRKQKTVFKGAGAMAGFGGIVSGMFGIGCAACGSFLLTPLLALAGAGGALTFLPFGGEEFGFLGVGLLGFSVITTGRKIQAPLICKTSKHE